MIFDEAKSNENQVMKFNEKELKVAVIRADTNYESLAKELGVSKSSFYNYINNGNFKLCDIHKIAKILKLSFSEINSIFFGI